MARSSKHDPSTTRTSRRPPRKSESPLGAYLGDVSKLGMLTPEQEQSLAAQIADGRVTYWRAILSYPPFVGAITTVIEQSMAADECEKIPSQALAQLAHSSRAFRDRETKANREAYHAAQREVARALADLDLDGKYADVIAADLDAIAAGLRDVPALSGWRREVFGEDALKLCEGRVALALKGENVEIVAL